MSAQDTPDGRLETYRVRFAGGPSMDGVIGQEEDGKFSTVWHRRLTVLGPGAAAGLLYAGLLALAAGSQTPPIFHPGAAGEPSRPHRRARRRASAAPASSQPSICLPRIGLGMATSWSLTADRRNKAAHHHFGCHAEDASGEGVDHVLIVPLASAFHPWQTFEGSAFGERRLVSAWVEAERV